jgi:formamidopyrimidine-DNA glycosylase
LDARDRVGARRLATVRPVPELLEVETYRLQAAALVGRRIARLEVPDDRFWRSEAPPTALDEVTVSRARRIGKVLLLDTDRATLGLRFGMTGRLVVDGDAAIDQLVYSGAGDRPEWRRLVVHLVDGGSAWVSDPRRLGWAELDPDEHRLGVDALVLGADSLDAALGTSRAPLKTRLMDQHRIAGLGNLLTDEILWRAALDPRRPAGELAGPERTALLAAIAEVLDELGRRGGSHRGDLQPHRVAGAVCPHEGEQLRRDLVGGRTTWWCPAHQR